jgi:hypothetical protein
MRTAVDHAQDQGLSERGACRLVKQPRGTRRYRPTQLEDEGARNRSRQRAEAEARNRRR